MPGAPKYTQKSLIVGRTEADRWCCVLCDRQLQTLSRHLVLPDEYCNHPHAAAIWQLCHQEMQLVQKQAGQTVVEHGTAAKHWVWLLTGVLTRHGGGGSVLAIKDFRRQPSAGTHANNTGDSCQQGAFLQLTGTIIL